MKKYIIAILSTLIVVLLGYIIYDKFIDKKEETKEPVKEYKVYNKGDQVKLSDGHTYTVLKDSDKTTDYVTVISNVGYTLTPNDTENTDVDIYVKVPSEEETEFFKVVYGDLNLVYDETITRILEVVRIKFLGVSVDELKEVDGARFRLLTLDDLYDFYGKDKFIINDWQIEYTGDKDLFNTITMIDSSIIKEGKKMPVLTVVNNQVLPWTMGINPVRPVLNVYKTNIK